MRKVLVLGGTGWLGARIAAEWRDRGAAVTVLGRGERPAPEGTALVAGDRDSARAYEELAGAWDEVVDVTMDADHARAALDALAGTAAHWTCISTISVYADTRSPGADESAAILEPADRGDPGPADERYDYGRTKVAIEHAVRTALPGRSLVIRPGLIVGPGDTSDRFGYWVARFALAGSGPVLAPDARGSRAQVIDVRDLAEFAVAAAADGADATVDAVGESLPLADVLGRSRAVAGHTGALVVRGDAWLAARDVRPWSGPRSLPLWLPESMAGFASRSHARYDALGGARRDLDETLRDTLADERARGLDRDRRSGLARRDELALLADAADRGDLPATGGPR